MDGFKELLENALSSAVNVSQLLDVPPTPDGAVGLKHILAGPAAVSSLGGVSVGWFVQQGCAMCHIPLAWALHATGRAELLHSWKSIGKV